MGGIAAEAHSAPTQLSNSTARRTACSKHRRVCEGSLGAGGSGDETGTSMDDIQSDQCISLTAPREPRSPDSAQTENALGKALDILVDKLYLT